MPKRHPDTGFERPVESRNSVSSNGLEWFDVNARRRNWILIIIALAFLLVYGASIRNGDPDIDAPAGDTVGQQ